MALAACGGDTRPASTIVRAEMEREPAPTLEADVDLHFSRAMLAALDRGIPLKLDLLLISERDGWLLHQRHAVQLRYLPLARRYLLRDLTTGAERSYARRTQLLAALDHWRVPLAPAWGALNEGDTIVASLELDREALPGPLRLPAMFRAEWRLRTPELKWPIAG